MLREQGFQFLYYVIPMLDLILNLLVMARTLIERHPRMLTEELDLGPMLGKRAHSFLIPSTRALSCDISTFSPVICSLKLSTLFEILMPMYPTNPNTVIHANPAIKIMILSSS